MKNQIVLLCVLFVLTAGVFAQDYVPSQQDLDQFYKTKTLIVLEENPMLEYNMVIKDVIEKEWKLTPYEFIKANEFEAKRMDPQYSFLVMTKVMFDRDNTKAQYKFLHLLLGGDYLRVNMMPDIVAIPMSFEDVEEESYIYKLASMVRLMHDHIDLITKRPDLITANVFKYYKDNLQDIRNKTMYVIGEELNKDINSESLIKKVYPFPVKIVSKEEITQAIEERRKDIIFLHKVGPEGTKLVARCYKLVIGADNPTLYYFDYHMIDDKHPDAFLKSDFVKMAKKGAE